MTQLQLAGQSEVPWAAARAAQEHITRNGPPLEIVTLKREIARATKRAEDLASLFGQADEGSIREVVRLRRKLDQAYLDFARTFAGRGA